MGDRLGLPCLGTPGAVDFLANPQLPSVASMANPLGGPGRGSSLGSETHPAFIYLFLYIPLAPWLKSCDQLPNQTKFRHPQYVPYISVYHKWRDQTHSSLTPFPADQPWIGSCMNHWRPILQGPSTELFPQFCCWTLDLAVAPLSLTSPGVLAL